MNQRLIELDDRRRVGLAKVGRHSRYLVDEAEDGTLTFHPAAVIPENLLESYPELAAQIAADQADHSRLVESRARRPRK